MDKGSADELTMGIKGVEAYENWIETVDTMTSAIREGRFPMDMMEAAHVGQIVTRRVNSNPEDWTSEVKMIERAPWRVAALAVLVRHGGALTLARIREEIQKYRPLTASQRRRLVGQGGQLSWHQAVANGMIRLQHDMLAVRTGFGEYEATSKGREMIERLKQQSGKAKG